MSNNLCQIVITLHHSEHANKVPSSGVTINDIDYYLLSSSSATDRDIVTVVKGTSITLKAYGGSSSNEAKILDSTAGNTIELKKGVGDIRHNYEVTQSLYIDVKIVYANSVYSSVITIKDHDGKFEQLLFFKGDKENSLNTLNLTPGGLYHCFDTGRTFLATGEHTKLLFATNVRDITDLDDIVVTSNEINFLNGLTDTLPSLLS